MKNKYKRILVGFLSMFLFMMVTVQNAYAYVGYIQGYKCPSCGATGTTYQYCGGSSVVRMDNWHEIAGYPGTLCYGREVDGSTMLQCMSPIPCGLHTAWVAGYHTEYSNHSSSVCYRSAFNRSTCSLK